MCDGCEMFPLVGIRYKVFLLNNLSVPFVRISTFVKSVKERTIMNMLC
jgi:hypothetical protein